MDTQHVRRDLTQRGDGRKRAEWSPQTIRWINRAIGSGLLITATVMGIQLGMDAPSVSPVSPSAIAEQVALLSGGTAVAQAIPGQPAGAQPGMDAPSVSPVAPSPIAEQAAPLSDGATVAQAMPDQPAGAQLGSAAPIVPPAAPPAIAAPAAPLSGGATVAQAMPGQPAGERQRQRRRP